MDLATGAHRLIVTMLHTDKAGNSKVLPECTLPLTATGVVDVLITDRAVFHFKDGNMVLTQLLSGFTLADVKESTEAKFTVALSE